MAAWLRVFDLNAKRDWLILITGHWITTFGVSSSSSISSCSFNVPSFLLLGLDMIWVTSTDVYPLFNFLLSSFTTLLQVFFGLPTGLLPSTSSSITLLGMLFSSQHFTWPNHLNPFFLNPYSMFSSPHLLLTSSLVTLFCHLALDVCILKFYLNSLLSKSI